MAALDRTGWLIAIRLHPPPPFDADGGDRPSPDPPDDDYLSSSPVGSRSFDTGPHDSDEVVAKQEALGVSDVDVVADVGARQVSQCVARVPLP